VGLLTMVDTQMRCDFCGCDVDVDQQLFALRVPPGRSLPIPAVTCSERHMDLLQGAGWRMPTRFELDRGRLILAALRKQP